MITSKQDYYDFLIQTQALNPTQIAVLPFAENDKICEVNLSARTITSPEFLSIQHDHKSEVIYFKLNRFYDYMDLSSTTCLIQYIDAHGQSHIYVVPYYDITTFNNENKMLIPWSLDSQATAYEGTVQFALQFYKIEKIEDKKTGELKPQFIYNLNTNLATGKVLYGLDAKRDEEGNLLPEFDIAPSLGEQVIAQVQELSNELHNKHLTWIDLY